MKFSASFAFAALGAIKAVSAANSFAGSNLYYAAGLNSSQTTTLVDGLQSAGMKVLRVWLDGQSSAQKGTDIDAYPDLEPSEIGTYNDTVLERLDTFMLATNAAGIKLIISMHSFNALQAGDVYGAEYGTGDFYQDATPQAQFDERLKHVLNHNHTTLGKPWSELSDYIFAFEAENEAMIGNGQTYIEDNQSWQCDRAETIKGVLGNSSGILVITGGESWMAESVQPDFLTCDALDVISIHAYGTGDFATASIETYVKQAQNAGKLLIFEEWGACYFDTSNNDCPTGTALSSDARSANIQNFTASITAAGMPWLYWQVIPNADPHSSEDYEVGLDDPSWDALKTAALAAAQAEAAFDFSSYLL